MKNIQPSALVLKMISYVLANQKGGVGKTSVSRHLIFRALEMKLRTLVIDFDPQANTTKTLLHLAKSANPTLDITEPGQVSDAGWLTTARLFHKDSKAQPMPVNEYASLIAADAELVDIADYSLDAIPQPRLSLGKFADQYDVCIIDTPPSQGKLLYAALAAANFVISPCTLDEDATDGLAALFQDIERVRDMEWNSDLKIMGIQINKMDKSSAHDRKALAALRDSVGDLVMKDIIYERAATRLAIRKPVWQGNRGENKGVAAVEMKAACNAILNHVAHQ
ncbi:ParA family protein [Massilia sp. CCM 8734]|uniref:ParA family protein n=1 Tax=Massilia sp. CCM 8734 TaxID=2609283 RepID=UPI00141E58D8|nr:ParA family protein [Massilia sp. CCM 8734]NHZ99074.1 AAA family ATPase [Massilia sp. CCM 8734]